VASDRSQTLVERELPIDLVREVPLG
jgi:hypothetical protein